MIGREVRVIGREVEGDWEGGEGDWEGGEGDSGTSRCACRSLPTQNVNEIN